MSYRNAFTNGKDSHPTLSAISAITSHTKSYKVIVKLNNLQIANKTKKKSTKEITPSINSYMQQNRFKTIRVVRTLRSRDVAIQTINESEGEMLRANMTRVQY